MTKWTEANFEGYHEYQLFYQLWTPPKSRGLLVITHGQGEHSESYLRLVRALSSIQWTILAWDLRGHGRSEGQRGYASHLLDYVRDFEMLWSQVLAKFPAGMPRVFLGHSMGGLIQLKALGGLLDGESQHQILSNPFLGLSVEVPLYKQVAAKILMERLPRTTLYNEIKNTDLTRDPLVIEEYERDVFRHHKISPGVYLGALETIPSVLHRADHWLGNFLMLLSDKDPVVNTQANLKFFEDLSSVNQKKIEIFSGFRHELLNDLGREQVIQKIGAFLATLGADSARF